MNCLGHLNIFNDYFYNIGKQVTNTAKNWEGGGWKDTFAPPVPKVGALVPLPPFPTPMYNQSYGHPFCTWLGLKAHFSFNYD